VSMPSQWAKWWAGESERTIINRHNRGNMERRGKIWHGWGNTRAIAEKLREVCFVRLSRTGEFAGHVNSKEDGHTVSLSNQNMAHKLVMYGRSLTVLAIQAQYLIHGYHEYCFRDYLPHKKTAILLNLPSDGTKFTASPCHTRIPK